MNIQEIISKKRDGFELTGEEIRLFIRAVVSQSISHAQTGAMLMAMYLNDLSFRESADLTKAMIETGRILSLGKFGKDVLVDKHSTGGVGDKVSLILAPSLAALGLKVPMISGWSLNHTGGTLDKLRSIPGFQVWLDSEQMEECLTRVGCFICTTTKDVAPADSVLYKMREMTTTVENRGLIAASILSKKATEGIGTLVLDVKFGRGSFSKTEEEAGKLADLMVKIGEELNLTTKAVISDMNCPIGRHVGNALEVVESVKCLRNEVDGDLLELVQFLGGVILEAKGLAENLQEGRKMILRTLADGSALNRFQKMLTSQGVLRSKAEELCSGHFWKVLPKSSRTTLLNSSKKGVVTKIDSLNVGKACWHLGRSGTQIDYSTGVVLLKIVGDHVERNEPWIEVHHSTEKVPSEIEDLIRSSLVVESNPKTPKNNLSMVVHF